MYGRASSTCDDVSPESRRPGISPRSSAVVLAQTNPPQRQTIVDVICAYLRMPYTPPDDQALGEDAPKDAHTRHEERRQELQVRLTAQRILSLSLIHI